MIEIGAEGSDRDKYRGVESGNGNCFLSMTKDQVEFKRWREGEETEPAAPASPESS